MIILGLRQFWHSKRPVSLVMNTSACPSNEACVWDLQRSENPYYIILSKFYLQAKLQQTNTSNTHQYSPTWLGCGNTTGTRIAYGYIATTLQYTSCMHFKLEDACEPQLVQHGECGECMYEYKHVQAHISPWPLVEPARLSLLLLPHFSQRNKEKLCSSGVQDSRTKLIESLLSPCIPRSCSYMGMDLISIVYRGILINDSQCILQIKSCITTARTYCCHQRSCITVWRILQVSENLQADHAPKILTSGPPSQIRPWEHHTWWPKASVGLFFHSFCTPFRGSILEHPFLLYMVIVLP